GFGQSTTSQQAPSPRPSPPQRGEREKMLRTAHSGCSPSPPSEGERVGVTGPVSGTATMRLAYADLPKRNLFGHALCSDRVFGIAIVRPSLKTYETNLSLLHDNCARLLRGRLAGRGRQYQWP